MKVAVKQSKWEMRDEYFIKSYSDLSFLMIWFGWSKFFNKGWRCIFKGYIKVCSRMGAAGFWVVWAHKVIRHQRMHLTYRSLEASAAISRDVMKVEGRVIAIVVSLL